MLLYFAREARCESSAQQLASRGIIECAQKFLPNSNRGLCVCVSKDGVTITNFFRIFILLAKITHINTRAEELDTPHE